MKAWCRRRRCGKLRLAEYVALIATSDVTGHFGVGVLLEGCLAGKLAFVERTYRLLGHFNLGAFVDLRQ